MRSSPLPAQCKGRCYQRARCKSPREAWWSESFQNVAERTTFNVIIKCCKLGKCAITLENNSKNIILHPIRSIEQHKHVSKFWVGCTAVCLLMGPAADCLFERVRALTCRKRNTAAAPRIRTSRARQNMWSAAKQRTVRLVPAADSVQLKHLGRPTMGGAG